MQYRKQIAIAGSILLAIWVLPWILLIMNTILYVPSFLFSVMIGSREHESNTFIIMGYIMIMVIGVILLLIIYGILINEVDITHESNRKIRKQDRTIAKQERKIKELEGIKLLKTRMTRLKSDQAKLNCEIKQLETIEVEQFKTCDCGAKLPLFACYCHKCGYHIQ